MAAARSLKDLEKHLECAVCLEQFKNPKVLVCLHTYCKECLEEMQKKSGKTSIVCPECRVETEIPKGRLDALPVNFFVNNILSVLALHGDSSATSIECDNCDSGEPPAARCSVCSFFLCDFCAEGHRRGKRTKTHQMMSLEEVKSSSSITLSKPSMCEEHEEEILKLFCQTCEKAICRDCTMVEHRDHQYLFVKEAYNKEKETIVELLQETKSKQAILQQAVTKVAQAKVSVETSASGAARDINTWIDELVHALEERRAELHQNVQGLSRAKTKELEIQQEQLQVALSCVRSSIDFTERAFQDGSQVEVLGMKKPITERLANLNSSTWQLEPCTSTALHFSADQTLLDRVKHVGVVKDNSASAARSTVQLGQTEDGMMYNLLRGQEREFRVQTRDINGDCVRTRGDDISVEITAPNENASRKLKVIECTPEGNGSYCFFYRPGAVGTYSMSVKVNGENVNGSPFMWDAIYWKLQDEDQAYLRYRRGSAISFFDDYQTAINVGHGSINNITGNSSWTYGCYSWKVQVVTDGLGEVAVGIREQGEIPADQNCHRPARRIPLSTAKYPQQKCRWWCWISGKKSHPDTEVLASGLPMWQDGDELNLYLNLDQKNLLIEHLRTSNVDVMDISDVVCPVVPFFRVIAQHDTVTLFDPGTAELGGD